MEIGVPAVVLHPRRLGPALPLKPFPIPRQAFDPAPVPDQKGTERVDSRFPLAEEDAGHAARGQIKIHRKASTQGGRYREGYEARGISEREAERRAWATVNSDDGRGKKSGSGRGIETGDRSAHMGGITGGEAASARPAANRAREATVTSEHNEHHAQS